MRGLDGPCYGYTTRIDGREVIESAVLNAGTRLAWIVDPKTKTVRVHLDLLDLTLLQAGDFLDGGDVIPGLRIAVEDLFELEAD